MDKKLIGQNLKKARKAKYKSQESFAEAIGVLDRKTISKWETGETEIPMTRLAEICNLLNCDMDFIFGKIDVFKNRISNITDETGLHEEAAKVLTDSNYTEVLNTILPNPHFTKILRVLSDCSPEQINQTEGRIISDRLKDILSEKQHMSSATFRFLQDVSRYGVSAYYKNILADEIGHMFDSIIEDYWSKQYIPELNLTFIPDKDGKFIVVNNAKRKNSF